MVAFLWPSPKAPRPTSSSKWQGRGIASGWGWESGGQDLPQQQSQSSFSRYSTNEGETWKTFTFSEKPVFVYGLLTEPGEKSTIFTIFGSYKENGHSWLILQINTTDVLGKGDGTVTDAGWCRWESRPVSTPRLCRSPRLKPAGPHTAQPALSTPVGASEVLPNHLWGAESKEGAWERFSEAQINLETSGYAPSSLVIEGTQSPTDEHGKLGA